ncbi:putative secreted protein [Aphis craccivora]|uniref:Putative secreted protein n=1 Tax=Aphis craccivora TaxID=307492 RepID=A0A6G0ZQN5_APHCR|nr:putative secreted protein [Aphis craccivora]
MTAVTRDADAILQAFIMINSSIKLSLTSPLPLCIIYTSSPLTDSPISTLKYILKKD